MVTDQPSRGPIPISGGSNGGQHPWDLRLLSVFLIVLAVFTVLSVQLWRLQIVEGHSYRQMADVNRFRVSPVSAQRGIIYDRNHTIVAANTPSFQVAIVPAALPTDDTSHIYLQLSSILSISPAEIAEKVKNRKGDDFTPVPIKSDVERDLVLRIEEQHHRLPGVIVVPESSRLYPSGALLSHILGYMLPVSEEELPVLQATRKEAGYRAEDKVGATGVEDTYEAELRGKPGQKLYEVDSTERPVADLRVDNPEPGHNLVLSIDLELQKDIAQILKDGMGESESAAAIVMNPKNGQVLAMVSLPNYDNNLFSGGVKASDLNTLLNDPRKPMINYATNGSFPPGSTFKLVTAAAALQSGVANAKTEIDCEGALLVPNQYNPKLTQRLPCWGVHGKQDFITGLANSCDVYYWTIGGGFKDFEGVGNVRLADFARQLGYGAPTGIDIPDEASGLVPSDEWKKKTWSEGWLKGDTYNMSIGQGFVLATPLQVANATNALVNGGHLYKPTVVSSIVDAEDKLIRNIEPQEVRQVGITPENLEIIKEGMKKVMETDDGKKFNIPALKVAGKTGSAEFPGPKDSKGMLPTHGWFTAFAPYDNPEISVTVFLQKGGGPSDATPLAMKIFKRYFHYDESTAPPTPTRGTVTPTPTRAAATPTRAAAAPTTAAAAPTTAPAIPTRAPATPTEVPATPTRIPATPTSVPATPTRVAVTPTRAAVPPTAPPQPGR